MDEDVRSLREAIPNGAISCSKKKKWSDISLDPIMTKKHAYLLQEYFGHFLLKGKVEWKFTRFFHHPTKQREHNSLDCMEYARATGRASGTCTTKNTLNHDCSK
jgi:hypothetical protein